MFPTNSASASGDQNSEDYQTDQVYTTQYNVYLSKV